MSSPKSETTLPLSESECLLLRPEPIGGGLAVQEVSGNVVETINLRTYGWADRHVFGATQEDLVSVRKASRRRPADVVRPKPFCGSPRVLVEAYAPPVIALEPGGPPPGPDC